MAKEAKSTEPESVWRRRGRKVLYWVIIVQLVSVVLFIGVLVLGERSRATLIALYLPRQPLLISAVGFAILAPLTRRRVRPLVAAQVVLALVVLFPVMGLSVSTSRSASERIRLASYNVHFGREGRTKLLDELAAMPADIIVLQASFGSMEDRIKERMPDRKVHQHSEWVLISRFPFRDVEEPPSLPDETSAMFMKYVIDTPRGALRVYNVHPYSPRHALYYDDETRKNLEHREAQIAAAVTAARTDVPPFVLVGDTNLPPMSAIGRRHLEGLKDAFDEVGFGFGYTFPAKRPWMRIDRALAGEGVRFLDVSVGPYGASDHRPLFVDFEITSGE